METTFENVSFDDKVDYNLIPKLTELSNDNIYFSDTDKWNEILEKVSAVLKDFLDDGHTHVQSFKKAETSLIAKFCDVCGKSISGEKEWNEHIKSKRHRANKRKSARLVQQTKKIKKN